MTITNKDKRECAEREAKLRRYVYPRWIESKKMSQQKADREIEVMEAIAADYRELETKDRLI